MTVSVTTSGVDVAFCDVTVVIAVNEDGLVKSCIYDPYRVQNSLNYEDWMSEIRNDKRLWTLKTIKTKVPLPGQYEVVP